MAPRFKRVWKAAGLKAGLIGIRPAIKLRGFEVGKSGWSLEANWAQGLAQARSKTNQLGAGDQTPKPSAVESQAKLRGRAKWKAKPSPETNREISEARGR